MEQKLSYFLKWKSQPKMLKSEHKWWTVYIFWAIYLILMVCPSCSTSATEIPATPHPTIGRSVRSTTASVIQIPTTTTTTPPIIPNRREIRDWVIVDRQIGSFYEVRVNSREGKLTWSWFISVSHHKCIEYICFHVKWYI